MCCRSEHSSNTEKLFFSDLAPQCPLVCSCSFLSGKQLRIQELQSRAPQYIQNQLSKTLESHCLQALWDVWLTLFSLRGWNTGQPHPPVSKWQRLNLNTDLLETQVHLGMPLLSLAQHPVILINRTHYPHAMCECSHLWGLLLLTSWDTTGMKTYEREMLSDPQSISLILKVRKQRPREV